MYASHFWGKLVGRGSYLGCVSPRGDVFRCSSVASLASSAVCSLASPSSGASGVCGDLRQRPSWAAGVQDAIACEGGQNMCSADASDKIGVSSHAGFASVDDHTVTLRIYVFVGILAFKAPITVDCIRIAGSQLRGLEFWSFELASWGMVALPRGSSDGFIATGDAACACDSQVCRVSAGCLSCGGLRRSRRVWAGCGASPPRRRMWRCLVGVPHQSRFRACRGRRPLRRLSSRTRSSA